MKTFSRSIRYAFWNTYDHAFFCIGLNFLWFIIHFIPIYLFCFTNPYSEILPNPLNFFGLIAFSSEAVSIAQYATPKANAPDFILFFHSLLLFGMFLYYNPFSFAIFRVNLDLFNRDQPTFFQYFKYVKKYFFKASIYLFFNILLVTFSYVNICFYQRIFVSQPFFAYFFTLSIFTMLFMYLHTSIHALPIIIKENKPFLDTMKRSYFISINYFSSTLLIICLFFFVLFCMKTHAIPGPDLLLPLFFFPVFLNQLIFEHYITTTEKYGNQRKYEELRSFKDFLFPWRIHH